MLYYLFFLVFITFNNSFSQKLNFTDLEYCLNHRVDEVDSYLARRGYEFVTYIEKDNTYSCSTTKWAFDRNIYDNYALAFLNKFCDEKNEGFVWFQPFDKNNFESIKSECLKLGFKFSSKTFDKEIGALNFEYIYKNYKIKFASGLNSDNSNVYAISLSKL